MDRDLGHGKIVLHQKEDDSVQLRDNLSYIWCACSKPAVEIVEDLHGTVYEFKCVSCYKIFNS